MNSDKVLKYMKSSGNLEGNIAFQQLRKSRTKMDEMIINKNQEKTHTLKSQKIKNFFFIKGAYLLSRTKNQKRKKYAKKTKLFTNPEFRISFYKKHIWKTQVFVIFYYISKFINLCKINSTKRRFQSLNKLHFDIIQDSSYFTQKEERINIFKQNLRKEKNQIIITKASKFVYKLRKYKFCNIIYNNFIFLILFKKY